MLSLNNEKAKLTSLNPRAEKHGDDNVPACDLKFQVDLHSKALDAFDTKMRAFIFRKPGAGEQQSLPLEQGDDLTQVRNPKLGSFAWDEDFPGYGMAISAGLEASEGLKLNDVEVSKFRWEPLNGGTVRFTFSVTAHPDAEEMGELYEMIGSDVQLSLSPPKADAQKKAA